MRLTIKYFVFSLAAIIICYNLICSPAASASQDVNALCARYGPDFDFVSNWLKSNPPLTPGSAERERVLKKLDAVFLEPDAKDMPCTGSFFQERMEAFMSDFESHKVESGVSIWKLYNHTEIIKTKDITIAIDLFPGFNQVAFKREMLEKLVDSIDVLLVTHVHGDHVSPEIVKMFIDRGKTVVAPTGMWQPGGEGAEVLTGNRDADYIRSHIVYVRDANLSFHGATVRAFASWQKETPCNAYLITTAQGRTVMHLGDMNVMLFQQGGVWFKKLREPLKIDVLIPNCWSPDLHVLLQTVKPSILVASHEHELGHPVSGRRPYSYVYGALGTLGVPFVVPAWGERLDWPATNVTY